MVPEMMLVVGPWSMVDGRFRGSIGWWINSSLGAGTHPWQISRSGLHGGLHRFFFDIILEPLFFEFWCQLGPNLGPNLGPKSTKNRSKSHPKSIQNRIIFLIAFLIYVWSIFDRFSTPKLIKNRSKNDQQIIPTTHQQKIKKL